MNERVHDFLELSYPEKGFLINKAQFFSSMLLDSEKPVKTRLPYFDSLIRYQDQNLLAFNLDCYLKEYYSCSGEEGMIMVLLTDLENFRDCNKNLFVKLISGAKIAISKRFLALKVGSRAVMSAVPLGEIKLMPGALGRSIAGKGLLGLRFKDNNPVSYFIDVETIAVDVIRTASRKVS